MLKSWRKVRSFIITFLLTICLILNTSSITQAQTSMINQLEIKGITRTIEGRTLTVPDFENISANLGKYRQGFEINIKKLPQFQKQLQKAAFEKLNIQLPQSIIPSPLAVVDNYWSKAEYTDVNVPKYQYVSGTVTCTGQNVPVAPAAGLPASYLELSDYMGSNSSNYSKRWVSGDQLVNGGCGILKALNGGKEPTGRLVWGTDTFKIVLDSANERTMKAEFSAYMRVCANLPTGRTCTPYFIRLPWFPVQGNNWIAIGGGLL